jgi:hypothetical protein
MSWLKQIIANSLDGNAVRVKEAVANEMNTRIETAKESIRMEVAQKLFGESVEDFEVEELDEAKSWKDMTDKQLEDWLEKNDTDKPGIGTAYGMQIKAARAELQRRKK